MQNNIGKNVKVISGKHAGVQGQLMSIEEDIFSGRSEAHVAVKRKTWLRFFHLIKAVTVSPDELALA